MQGGSPRGISNAYQVNALPRWTARFKTVTLRCFSDAQRGQWTDSASAANFRPTAGTNRLPRSSRCGE